MTEGSVTFIEGGTCAIPITTHAGPTPLNGSGQASFNTSSLSVGSHTITACYGGSTNYQASSGDVAYLILDVPPTVTAPADQDANEGTPTAINLGSFTDLGGDGPWQVTVNWGDGTPDTGFSVGGPGSLGMQTHTYADNAQYTVTVTVTDAIAGNSGTPGPDSGSATFKINVANIPPDLTTPGDQTAFEGTLKYFNLGSFSDPGADGPWTVKIEWGDSTSNTLYSVDSPGSLGTKPHTYADDGLYTVKVTVTEDNGAGIFDSVEFQVNVYNVKPVVTPPGNQNAAEGASTSFALGSFTDPGPDGPWQVTVNWGDGLADPDFTMTAPGALPARSHTYVNNGTYTVTVTVTEDGGVASDSKTFQVVVSDVAPVVTVNPSSQTRQYSDPIGTVTIYATDQGASDSLSVLYSYSTNGGANYTPGLPAGISGTNAPGLGPKTWTISGVANVPAGTYLIRIRVSDGDLYTDATTTLHVAKEDAHATYTGALFASTSSTASSTATVTLAATIQDITALPSDPLYDAPPGDIRNAIVKFVNRADGTTLCTANVGLVSPGDLKTGTATCNWTANIGSSDSVPYTVGIIVYGQYYTGDYPYDDTVVTVSKPISNFITGGGYLVMQSSAGLYPGGLGTKNNFGFNVKYNKQGTNLQGNINTIIRNNGRVYQIKGNAMTSLSANVATGKATFNGKANIQDITDPLNLIAIDGNATLQVTMTDKVSPAALTRSASRSGTKPVGSGSPATGTGRKRSSGRSAVATS